MPTPVGHALAGLATGWFLSAGRVARGLLAACVLLAIAPDIDILFGSHRTYTHSVGAALIVGVAAWFIFRNVAAALILCAAYGTHVLLDWLSRDTAPPFGLMALWPFSSRFYVSGVDLFLEVSRRYWKMDEFIWGNLKAVGWEIAILLPIAILGWIVNRRSAVD